MNAPVKRDEWFNARVRITRSGKIQAKIPASAVSRRRNISQGFVDAEGRFHPIRAASDYDAGRTGESGSKRKGRKRTAPKAKARAGKKTAKKKVARRRR